MVTSSDDATQGIFEIVQRSTTVPAEGTPVIAEAGFVGAVIVAVPDTTVQLPMPMAGMFPARVAVEVQIS
jgi:hypothetical protein